MMEGRPNQDNNKRIEKQALITILHEKGFEDAEAKAMLVTWTIQKEKEVEKNDSSKTRIEFEMERAELYFSAGNTEYALEAFEDALTQAHNENDEELYNKILDRIEEIEGGIDEGVHN